MARIVTVFAAVVAALLVASAHGHDSEARHGLGKHNRNHHNYNDGADNNGSPHRRLSRAGEAKIRAALEGAALRPGGRPLHRGGHSHHHQEHAAAMNLQQQYQAGSLTANATVAIGTTLFNKVGSAVDDIINTVAKSIVIPGETTKHFSFSNVAFSQFDIGSVTVATTSPNNIAMTVSDITIAVPATDFHVYTHIIFKVSCGGEFWATISGASITINLEVGTSPSGDGTLRIVSASTTADLQGINVGHKWKEVTCTIAQDIIQLFVGNINSLIDNAIRKLLPAKITPAVEDALNKVFNKIPFFVTGTPQVSSSGIAVTVDLLRRRAPTTTTVVASPPLRLGAQQQESVIINRDLILSIPEQSVDNLLAVAGADGKLQYNTTLEKETTTIFQLLLPSAYAACPACPLNVLVFVEQIPRVTFAGDNVSAAIQGAIVAIRAVQNNNSAVTVPLFSIALGATAGLNDFTVSPPAPGVNESLIDFTLGLSNLNISLAASSVGPIPVIDQLAPLLESLIETVVVPDFNKKFKGIPVPAVLGDIVVNPAFGAIEIGANLNL